MQDRWGFQAFSRLLLLLACVVGAMLQSCGIPSPSREPGGGLGSFSESGVDLTAANTGDEPHSDENGLPAYHDSEDDRTAPSLRFSSMPHVPIPDPVPAPAIVTGPGVYDVSAAFPLRKSGGVSVETQRGLCSLNAQSGGGSSWVMYELNCAVVDFPTILRLDLYETGDLDPKSPRAQLPPALWLGVSQFPEGSWYWQKLEPPSLSNWVSLPKLSSFIDAGGHGYLVVLVDQVNRVSIKGLGLEVDAFAPPPRNLTCTRGSYKDRIVLTWNDPYQDYGFRPDAIVVERKLGDSFEVWGFADDSNQFVVSKDQQPAHAQLLPFDPVSFRLRLVHDGVAGPPGPVCRGFIGLGKPNLATIGNFVDRIRIDIGPLSPSTADQVELRYYSSDPLAAMTGWRYLAMVPASQDYFDHLGQMPGDLDCLLNVAYQYQSRLLYKGQAGPWSKVITRSRSFDPPTSLTASAGTMEAGVLLAWNTPGGVDAVEILRDGSDDSAVIAEVSGNTYMDSGPLDYLPHSYQVRCRLGQDRSSLSPAVEGYRSRWQAYTLPLTARPLDAVLIGGKAALLAMTAGEDLYYCRALTESPLGPGDWQISQCYLKPDDQRIDTAGLLAAGAQPIVLIQQHPKAAYYSRIDLEIVCLNAPGPDPQGPGDWNQHTVDSRLQYEGYQNCSFESAGGKPVVLVSDFYDDELDLLQAQLIPPQAPADWLSSQADAISGELGIVDLLELDGRPAWVSYDSQGWQPGSAQLRFGRALSDQPAGPGDWSIHSVAIASDNLHYEPRLLGLSCADSIVLGLLEDDASSGDYSLTGPCRVLVANGHNPGSSADWSSYLLAAPKLMAKSSIRGGLVADKPVLMLTAVVDGGSGSQACPLYCPANSTLPQSGDDWTPELLPAGGEPAGRPLVTANQVGILYGGIQTYALEPLRYGFLGLN